jgi:hypothetical protein
MTDKQKRFCEEYVKDWNGTRAYKAAYPKPKSSNTAAVCAINLLKKDCIKKEIERLKPIQAKYRLKVRTKKVTNKTGFVYLFNCVGFDLYKIGKANDNVLSRLNTCQTGCPFQLVISECWEVPNYHALEKRLHSLFKKKHKRGEWFELSEHDLLIINDFMAGKSIIKPLKTLFNG